MKQRADFTLHAVIIGVFRRGNKPPVLPGEENERSKNKNGKLKASRKNYEKEEPPSIIVSGLAAALLKYKEVFHNENKE